MKTAAIYARVSSDKQREENTIASQTSALIAFGREQNCDVPAEWVIEDDGYSGASLLRPGLERLRDLAAEGLIQVALVYAPDRLSRRYAHQILLIEEFARAGVEILFIRSKRAATPEDELLLQFQGMIAEYERAQILERSRRGKRHRARQGQVSVLSGAPFGYRYRRKTDRSAAYYEIDEEQARVVRWVYELYTAQGRSIGAITRELYERQIPTAKGAGRWERSTVWAMLRNPAYRGTACFGKTRIAPRMRVTRPLRLRGGATPRNSANHELPRADWIEIPVPPIICEETFALAEERLESNKKHAPRRTITPSVMQGLASCAKCGYGLYRTSARSSVRVIYYYRCLGSDGWRRLGGPVCDNRPVRQDLLDEVVWKEVVRLLEDQSLIEGELDRRLKAARNADPTQRREDTLRRDLARCRKCIERLLTAYQESLLSIEELRNRMPDLRGREQACLLELQAIEDQSKEREICLRLAESVMSFLSRLRSSAETLDISERQRVLRLLVKEVLVGDDKIVIRHSIPMPHEPSGGKSPDPAERSATAPPPPQSYLLRSGRPLAALEQHHADGPRPGAGAARACFRPLRGRLQRVSRQQSRCRTRVRSDPALRGGHTQAAHQFGDECGGARRRARLPRVRIDRAGEGAAEDRQREPPAISPARQRRAAPMSRDERRQDHRSAEPAPARLDELLPPRRGQGCVGGPGRVDQAQAAGPDMAPSQTLGHTSQTVDEARTEGEASLALGDQRARPLVECRGKPYERRLPKVLLRPHETRLAGGHPPALSVSVMNRRMRNRTSGGAGGRRR
jgi:site-specific DNA recombinase